MFDRFLGVLLNLYSKIFETICIYIYILKLITVRNRTHLYDKFCERALSSYGAVNVEVFTIPFTFFTGVRAFLTYYTFLFKLHFKIKEILIYSSLQFLNYLLQSKTGLKMLL